jgi:hypothetical protein
MKKFRKVYFKHKTMKVTNANKALLKAQCAVPYNVANELAAMEEVSGLQEGLEFAQAILAERF